ncbi:hypothetical protein [Botrimarina mediterranea]|uniref:PEP-CTERM protein-sorting domain-containing protein n=1 Tax=Botrimarina mediterranea TaxID=2528022 RepID=A0A518KDS4_9BACT|nr:hypothetical protein [Botrimarina mediterranea]QDV75944.1 hypothetical protein Spa11_41670 [Botrimarina mediterranea]QDV80539.1 hypothetical protein K2D_41680 [Planctomycetes bacterium K2D]
MKRTMCAALAALASAAVPAAAAPLFTENFDTNATTRWSTPIVDAEIGVFDGSVIYGFDYTPIGIPAAPNGGGKALFMEVNLNNQTGAQGESVVILANDVTLPSGNFKLTMDVWFNVESSNGGTTEFGVFGVHAAAPNDPTNDAVTDDAPFQFGISNGNGLSWIASGDSGASNDFVRFVDPNNAGGGSQLNLGNYDSRPPIPGLADQSGLGPRNTWIEVGIEKTGSTYIFSINGSPIDTYEDVGGVLSGGTIMVGYNDAFNSVADLNLQPGPDPNPLVDDGLWEGDELFGSAHFILIDNIVLVPEPTSATLGFLAFAVFVARRRS